MRESKEAAIPCYFSAADVFSTLSSMSTDTDRPGVREVLARLEVEASYRSITEPS